MRHSQLVNCWQQLSFKTRQLLISLWSIIGDKYIQWTNVFYRSSFRENTLCVGVDKNYVCYEMRLYMFQGSRILLPNIDSSDAMRKNDKLPDRLTKREHEILTLLARGMTRDEMAEKLYISSETVKMHTKNLYKKLKAKNKVDALLKAKMIWSTVEQW